MKNESRTQNAPYARACVEEIAPAIMNPGEWQSITFPWLPHNLQNNWNTVRIMSRRRSLHSKFTKLSTDKNKIMPRERQRKALLVSFFLPTVPVQFTGLGTSDRNFTAIC